jgi:hypothetical protein
LFTVEIFTAELGKRLGDVHPRGAGEVSEIPYKYWRFAMPRACAAPVPRHTAVEGVHSTDFTATYFVINFIDEKIHRAKTIIVL